MEKNLLVEKLSELTSVVKNSSSPCFAIYEVFEVKEIPGSFGQSAICLVHLFGSYFLKEDAEKERNFLSEILECDIRVLPKVVNL